MLAEPALRVEDSRGLQLKSEGLLEDWRGNDLTAQQSRSPVPEAGVEEAAVRGVRKPVVVSKPLVEAETGASEGVLLSGGTPRSRHQR